MSKKLYDHFIATNYANIGVKIQQEKKKVKPQPTAKDKDF